MCKCTPEIRTPFCGKPGCEWPESETKTEYETVGTMRLNTEGYIAQLLQLFNGVTWDGDLISKSHRTELIKNELAERTDDGGWNLITKKGVRYLDELGLVKS